MKLEGRMGFLSNRRLVILPTTRCALSVRLVHADTAVSQPRRDPLLEQPLPITPAVSPPRLGGYSLVREMLQRGAGLTAMPNRSRLSADGRAARALHLLRPHRVRSKPQPPARRPRV